MVSGDRPGGNICRRAKTRPVATAEAAAAAAMLPTDFQCLSARRHGSHEANEKRIAKSGDADGAAGPWTTRRKKLPTAASTFLGPRSHMVSRVA